MDDEGYINCSITDNHWTGTTEKKTVKYVSVIVSDSDAVRACRKLGKNSSGNPWELPTEKDFRGLLFQDGLALENHQSWLSENIVPQKFKNEMKNLRFWSSTASRSQPQPAAYFDYTKETPWVGFADRNWIKGVNAVRCVSR